MEYDNENTTNSKILSGYVALFILVLGGLSNSFSFLIFHKLGNLKKENSSNGKQSTVILIKKFNKQSENSFKKSKLKTRRQYTVYSYLAILSLFDITVLIFGLFNDWITDFEIVNLKTHSSFLCKFISFCAFLTSHMSSWTVVIITTIRMLAIKNPFRATQLTKPKNVKKVILGLFIFFSLFNMHLLWFKNIQSISKKDYLTVNINKSFTNYNIPNLSNIQLHVEVECRLNNNFFTEKIWPIIDKLFYCFIPFVLQIVISSVIIKSINFKKEGIKTFLYVSKFKLSSSKREKSVGLETSSFIINDSKPPNSYNPVLNGNNFQLDLTLKAKYKKYFLVDKKFTFMLLSVSLLFVILTSPIVLLYVSMSSIQNYIESLADLNRSVRLYDLLTKVQQATYLLMYLNHSVNFFVYFIMCPRFRRMFCHTFLKIFCLGKNIFKMKTTKENISDMSLM
jgi:hypothetical protein